MPGTDINCGTYMLRHTKAAIEQRKLDRGLDEKNEWDSCSSEGRKNDFLMIVRQLFDIIMSVFGTSGKVNGVLAADESGTCVIVSYHEESSARAALKKLDGRSSSDLGGRSLHIRYSAQSLGKV
ncbi:unnamed protein product [Fraxinus pennsylvanica]|uniref:RRM domain-containing protein n=1 Tax=Fraxinus pennsylvanica TaxID=56036 RepID=A0AAD2E807_9LAMI|nr:unnamed protein product [Fraxinus pennsylvanica]